MEANEMEPWAGDGSCGRRFRLRRNRDVSPSYTTPTHTFVGQNWFYATVPRCCPPRYDAPKYWSASLGSLEEVFHVLLRRRLQTTDYIPLWKSLAQPSAQEIPKEVLRNQRARTDPMDRQRHLVADPAPPPSSSNGGLRPLQGASLDYTAFVVEHFDAGEATVTGGDGVTVRA